MKLNSINAQEHTLLRSLFRRLFVFLLLAAASKDAVYFAANGFDAFASYLFKGLAKVYDTIWKITGAVAAVAIASTAFTLMSGTQNAVEKVKRILLLTIIGLFIIWAAPLVVLAARTPVMSYTSNPGAMSEPFSALEGLSAKIQAIWVAAEKIVLPLAGVSIAFGGFMFFGINILGNLSMDRQVERGKMVIRYTVIAVVAFYLIPVVFKSAYLLFASEGWNPPAPGA